MEQYSQYLMYSVMKSSSSSSKKSSYSSWEEEAFAEDGRRGPLGGFVWPPRSYSCSFCRREFKSAQALGGHMNVHRREKASLKHHPQTTTTTATHPAQINLLHIKKEQQSSSSLINGEAKQILGSSQEMSLHDSSTTCDINYKTCRSHHVYDHETNLVSGFRHLDSSSSSNIIAGGKRRKTTMNHDHTTTPIMAGTLDLELRLAS